VAKVRDSIFGHGFLAWIETVDGLVSVDTGWDVAAGEPYEGSDLEALVKMSARSGKELTAVLLTHDHPDHCMNLPLLLERWPDARVYAHPNSNADGVTHHLHGGENLQIGGEAIEVLYTPGHSQSRDELCYYLPGEHFLFSGDVAQPQGPSYAFANGPSPVPFFHFGDEYARSLERLIALDPQAMRTGHGDFLGPEQARQWLRVTLATVTRIQELALDLAERYPERESGWLAEAVYDQVADERNYGLRAANRRKREGSYEGLSDYERFDKPGILWAVEQARAII
jgi:glyoxylase-like metal-dependent hydrolase (beta-lactamase superfamily II)